MSPVVASYSPSSAVYEQRMSQASYFVARMSKENENLGQQLNEESMIAQQAMQHQLQEGVVNQQLRQSLNEQLCRVDEGLKLSYEEHIAHNHSQIKDFVEKNEQKMAEQGEQGALARRLLRHEMEQNAQTYQHSEVRAKVESDEHQKVSVFWHTEAQKEAQRSRVAEQFCHTEVAQCKAQEQNFRQQLAAASSQSYDQNTKAHLQYVEQEALDHVKRANANAESAARTCEQKVQLMNEEVYAKSQGILISETQTRSFRLEAVRLQEVLDKERVTFQSMQQNCSKYQNDALAMNSKYIEALREVDRLKHEHMEEAGLCRQESRMCQSEHQLYMETYDVWQHSLSAPLPRLVTPPGLSQRTDAPAGNNPQLPQRFNMAEESLAAIDVPKTKESDKVQVPAFPTITSLLMWQTALSQALVQTSGSRDIQSVVKWISEVWSPGSSFLGLKDSGGDAFVTLDVKLATAMQAMIAHGGQDAKELKDLVSRRMEEALKNFTLIKGRQIVFLLLENFKTFDNSEVVYGLIILPIVIVVLI